MKRASKVSNVLMSMVKFISSKNKGYFFYWKYTPPQKAVP